MRNKSLIVGSWVALAAALLSWCGVALFPVLLFQMQDERVAYLNDVAAASLRQAQTVQLNALVRETAENRTVVANALNVDVLSAVNAVESVHSSDVKVQVEGAQAERAIPSKNATSPVNAVSLMAHAEGPFSDLMRIVQLLEALPLATTVQQIDISRAPIDPGQKNSTARWTLNVRLRLLTTVPLST